MLNYVNSYSNIKQLAFIAHGHCYFWHGGLISLHLGSDALIALAYYSIPFTLVYFVRKRPDLPYPWLFLLFGAFIVACGTTHIMEIWTLWHPDYWIYGIIKAITAFISIYTAIAFIPIIPRLLNIPSTKALEQEIQQRQETEAALRTSQERLAGILTMAEDGIISINDHQQITLFNQGAEKIFGWQAAEVINKSLDILLPTRFHDIHYHYLQQFVCSSVQSKRMGKRQEIVALRRDGQEFPAEASVSKLRFPNETVFTVFLRDISDRKQIEQGIRASEEKFRKVFEEGPLGMAIVDLDYRFVNVNDTLLKILVIASKQKKN